MEENKKPETTSQQDSAPADYSRYMGTLNRIYRRNNNPKKKRLGVFTVRSMLRSTSRLMSLTAAPRA